MSDTPQKGSSDVVLLGPPTPDGAGVLVLRAREDRLEAGEVRPAREGAPLAPSTELVRLVPREGAPRVCDVEVAYTAPRAKGPARVTSTRYRAGWDAVFGEDAEDTPPPSRPS